MTDLRRISSLLACAAAVLLAAPAARAYCRATPCDPASGTCKTDAHGCPTEGPPLFWPNGRVRLSVDANGSPLRGISGEDALSAVSEALDAWQSATCADGGHPAIHGTDASVSGGLTANFVSGGPNTNVVLFRDDGWSLGRTVVGKTALGLNLDTGEILDADIQLDSEQFAFSVDADAGGIDLAAVLTHEIGHLFGLGHTDVRGATMQPETTGFGTVELRSLEPDDMAGICAIYPPGGASPSTTTTPRVDEAPSSGCSIVRGANPSPPAAFAVVVVSLASLLRFGSSRHRARSRDRRFVL